MLEEKKNVAKSVARRPEALHIYGVDLLSTSELLSYFSGEEEGSIRSAHLYALVIQDVPHQDLHNQSLGSWP